MGTFEALREYRLREKTEEGFRIDKQYNDAHVTRSKTTTSLEGRFFCQFVAYGYEEYFQSKINQVKESLAVPTGNPIHDNSDTFKKEKALLNWLNKMSVSKLFDWFDAIQETTVDSEIGKNRWRTETIDQDRLFLRKLWGIKLQFCDYKSDFTLKVFSMAAENRACQGFRVDGFAHMRDWFTYYCKLSKYMVKFIN